jgi:hypothetical protein
MLLNDNPETQEEGEEVMFKQLVHNDLTKRGGARITIFTDKIDNGLEFATVKGNIILNKTQEIDGLKLSVEDLNRAMQARGFSAKLTGKNKSGGTVVVSYPKDFYKTPDIGGKGTGSGTKAEDAELVLFRKELNKIMEETKTPFVPIKMNNRIINVSDVKSTEGPGGGKNTPKSDFTLMDINDKPIGYISHKAGTKASSFQQYGGLTADNIFNTDKEVKKFMSDLQLLYPNGLSNSITVWRAIKSDKIALHSVYGRDYGKVPGMFNVDEFHLGNMKLEKEGKTYHITSLHKGTNGDVPKGDFATVFIARYDTNSYTAAGVTVKRCRVGVFARGKVHSRAIQI